ncbi:MAG: four helix bundle protein [Candidatus Acidiferrales bacterium]
MADVIRSYRDLKVWQKSMDLVDACYDLSERFPKKEMFGLASQIQRASVSVPANIAEGHGREHLGDYIRHLSFAKGSLVELETLLIIAARRKYLPQSELGRLLGRTDEIGRILTALKRSLKLKKTTSALEPDGSGT